MATKLKNFSTNAVTKFTAFLLVVIIITSSVVETMYVLGVDTNFESLFYKEYKDSDSFYYEVRGAYNDALSILRDHAKESVEVKTQSNEAIREIKRDIQYYYYISDGKNVYTNAPSKDKSYFKQFDEAFYAYENGNWTFGKNTKNLVELIYYSDNYTIYIAFPDEYMQKMQTQWAKDRQEILPEATAILIGLAISALLVIYLIIVAGRKPQDNKLHMSSIDGIFTDVLFIVLVIVGFIWISAVARYSYFNIDIGRIGSEHTLELIFTGVVTAIVTVVCGIIILSLSRQFKAGKLFTHSIIYSMFDLFKSLFDGRVFKNYPLTKSLFYRQMMFIIASAGLVFLTLIFGITFSALAIIPPLIEIVIIYWYIKGNNQTFEEINKGFNENLEEKMKSERMKIELITNVSHDLKTPLTSIISYVDLLSKEDLSDTSRDYVNILIDKSNRLKNIVSDLFDLAKSNSGDISTDMEKLDLKKLIEQTIADMEDKIEDSELQLKVVLPEEPVIIMADGKKLYRVFQNVIDNALKYSLKGTRVFIELKKYKSNAVATVKNTACYEMNFTEDEILQRFTRGDKSRTTEGSGLGLSIAESFTNVCKGLFNLDIDGDLFKVSISFKIEE